MLIYKITIINSNKNLHEARRNSTYQESKIINHDHNLDFIIFM